MPRLAVALGVAALFALPGLLLARGSADLGVLVDGAPVVDASPRFFNGTLTQALGPLDACRPAACVDVPLSLDVPAGYWNGVHGGIELTAHSRSGAVRIQLLAASGAILATGPPGAPDSVIVSRGLTSGDYVVRVFATRAPASFTAFLQRETRAQLPAVALMPDLVVLPITTMSDNWEATKTSVSCRPYEALSAPTNQPMRCLRFDTTLGNIGDGGLLLTIPRDEALAGAALGGAQFTQRVERTDYSHDAYAAGPAVYHAGHNHFHYAAMVENTLYAYDTATQTRGAIVAGGTKEGFCPLDMGLIALGMPGTQSPIDSACQVGGDIALRLDANYYDVYYSNIDDQYVDITNVPPGVYELVTRVNPDAALQETRLDNNDARVLVRIDANDARAIEGTS